MVQGGSAVSVPLSAQTQNQAPVQTGSSASPFANQGSAVTGLSPDASSASKLDQAVKQVNESFQQKGQNLYAAFEKDKTTGINIVKIVDKRTNETISQMPSEEIVKLAQFLENPQGMGGKLLDTIA